MAAVATHSLVDLQKVLDTWAAAGRPSDEEVIEFTEGALRELRNDPNQQFQENVKQAAVSANQVDASFNTVTRSFEDMVSRYGAQFPQLATYLNEWRGYRTRWDRYLRDSRDVASQHVVILRRFDQIFLAMVEQIQTNQDRLDVIDELQQFINEDHRDSIIMSDNFQTLGRDIEHFVVRFNRWIIEQGVVLQDQAKELQRQIEGILLEIEGLDKQISDATLALAISGGLLNVIGMIVSGSLLASFQAQRTEKERELHRKQLDLAQVNLSQVALAHLNTQFSILKPDFALICDKLLLFSQIWLSVRSQCVQFREHLQGGAGAETNMRFRMEVRLAREVCLPLMEGLQRYATELANRP